MRKEKKNIGMNTEKLLIKEQKLETLMRKKI
jgi:hypothetical protein